MSQSSKNKNLVNSASPCGSTKSPNVANMAPVKKSKSETGDRGKLDAEKLGDTGKAKGCVAAKGLEGDKTSWIQCDDCDGWELLENSGLNKQQIKALKTVKFTCRMCKMEKKLSGCGSV
jgi:hypothetical protein